MIGFRVLAQRLVCQVGRIAAFKHDLAGTGHDLRECSVDHIIGRSQDWMAINECLKRLTKCRKIDGIVESGPTERRDRQRCQAPAGAETKVTAA